MNEQLGTLLYEWANGAISIDEVAARADVLHVECIGRSKENTPVANLLLSILHGWWDRPDPQYKTIASYNEIIRKNMVIA